MRLVVLTWEEDKPVEVGRVVLVDGKAFPDYHVAQVLSSLDLKTKPEDGEAYLKEVAERLHNAPYLWAELQEDDEDPYTEWEPPPPVTSVTEDPNFDRFINDIEIEVE